MKTSRICCLVALALAPALLNAFKPLTVDDSVYYYYAAHIAEHPLDPYGFKLGGVRPANEILAPPVMLYCWAGALRLFGDQPFLWKLSLVPFCLLLTFALHALCRRFARGLEMPLVTLTVLSPVVLPCLNLMLDVPALALSLGALVVFLRGCDQGSWLRAVAAGLLAGLAMEAKYTAFVAPAVMVAYAVRAGRLRQGLLAAMVAVGVFAGWEWLMAVAYGQSHFVYALRERDESVWQKLRLAGPLVGLLGGVGPALLLLNLTALRLPRWVVAMTAAVTLLGLGLVALVPTPQAILLHDSHSGKPLLSLHGLVFGTLGLAVCASTAAVLWRLCRLWLPDAWRAAHWGRWRVEGFLAAWLGLELAGYFALSPYPAVRRVMGLTVAAALLAGRLAARTCRREPRRRLVWATALASALLGLGYFMVDFCHYRAEERIAGRVARHLARQHNGGKVWFLGNGAFEFYAGRAGMKPFGFGGVPPRPGDWIVVVEKRGSEWLDTPFKMLRGSAVDRLRVTARLPVTTRYQFGGSAMEHLDGSRMEVGIFRAPGP
jgi:hypothetical protein